MASLLRCTGPRLRCAGTTRPDSPCGTAGVSQDDRGDQHAPEDDGPPDQSGQGGVAVPEPVDLSDELSCVLFHRVLLSGLSLFGRRSGAGGWKCAAAARRRSGAVGDREHSSCSQGAKPPAGLAFGRLGVAQEHRALARRRASARRWGTAWASMAASWSGTGPCSRAGGRGGWKDADPPPFPDARHRRGTRRGWMVQGL